jgi:hypothetical protein
VAPRPIANGTLHLGDFVLLDLDATAVRLNLSTRSVRRLMRDGALASILHGGRRMVAEAEIHDFIAREVAASARQRAARARTHRNANRASTTS